MPQKFGVKGAPKTLGGKYKISCNATWMLVIFDSKSGVAESTSKVAVVLVLDTRGLDVVGRIRGERRFKLAFGG